MRKLKKRIPNQTVAIYSPTRVVGPNAINPTLVVEVARMFTELGIDATFARPHISMVPSGRVCERMKSHCVPTMRMMPAAAA